MTLEVESEGKLVSPKLDDVTRALSWLTPKQPSFLVLEREERDYLQAGGSAGGMTVEWREYEGDSFRHYVAGFQGGDSTAEVEVPMSEGSVTVRANEVLDLPTAQATFTAFFNGEPRPQALAWRDVTERFA